MVAVTMDLETGGDVSDFLPDEYRNVAVLATAVIMAIYGLDLFLIFSSQASLAYGNRYIFVLYPDSSPSILIPG